MTDEEILKNHRRAQELFHQLWDPNYEKRLAALSGLLGTKITDKRAKTKQVNSTKRTIPVLTPGIK